MPVVGSVDITLGTLALVAPTRAGLLYMGCWGFFTALAPAARGRRLVGVSGTVLQFRRALADAVGAWRGHHRPSWFTVITEVPRFTVARAQTAQLVLRGIMASMLIGHGAFGLIMGKPNLLRFYEAAGLGVFGVPLPTLSAAIGGFEMLLGVLCLEATWPAFFVFVCVWKLGTEFLYVPAQAYGAWWEVLERGSSYAAPLLWIGFQQVLTAHGVAAQGLIPAAGGSRAAARLGTRRCASSPNCRHISGRPIRRTHAVDRSPRSHDLHDRDSAGPPGLHRRGLYLGGHQFPCRLPSVM